MQEINFFELAELCVDTFKNEHNTGSDRYVRTLYVSISEDNQVSCSITPHVLRNASKCILIHERSTCAATNYYSWYKVQYINGNGCVFDECFGDGYTLKTAIYGSYLNRKIEFRLNDMVLYSFWAPFEDKIAKIWELYQNVKDIKSEREVKMVADMFRKDERLFELGREIDGFKYENHILKLERDQYRDLLDEIKEMVNNQAPK